MATDSINLVNEDDARRVLLALLEEVAHARCADADEHLYEVRAGDGEERNIGLASDGASQKSLARSRRPHHQDAFRNAPTEFLKFLRLFEEFNNLLQLLFGFLDARHILERDTFLLVVQKLCARLAKRESLVAARL